MQMKQETKEKIIKSIKVYEKYLLMFMGFYGVLSGIILFLYFYTRINKFNSLLFLISILLGLLVIILTKKRVFRDTESIDLTKI